MPSYKNTAEGIHFLIHADENPATAFDFDYSHLYTASTSNGPEICKLSSDEANVAGEDKYQFHHPPLLGVDNGFTKYLLEQMPSIEQVWRAILHDDLLRLEHSETDEFILLLLPRWTWELPDGSPVLVDLTVPRKSCVYPCVWLSPERLWNMTPGVITIADFRRFVGVQVTAPWAKTLLFSLNDELVSSLPDPAIGYARLEFEDGSVIQDGHSQPWEAIQRLQKYRAEGPIAFFSKTEATLGWIIAAKWAAWNAEGKQWGERTIELQVNGYGEISIRHLQRIAREEMALPYAPKRAGR